MPVFDKKAFRIDYRQAGVPAHVIGMTYVHLPYSTLKEQREDLEKRGATITRVLVGDTDVWYRELPKSSAS